MDLHTVTAVHRPGSLESAPPWDDRTAWLAGGTWLFSEPQPAIQTLIDLEKLAWPALTASADGLEIAATCKIAELERFTAPPEWQAAPLIRQCCRSLLASFKIWNEATVGGNICMSLPAGAMISLTAALEGVLTLWPRDGAPRQVPVVEFVTGNHVNVLAPGELLRSVWLPASALRKTFAFRRFSLTHEGRSSVLLIGTRCPADGSFLLTITAATVRPVQLRFASVPAAEELRATIARTIPFEDYFDDVNGSPEHRQHLTDYFALQIREELTTAGHS